MDTRVALTHSLASTGMRLLEEFHRCDRDEAKVRTDCIQPDNVPEREVICLSLFAAPADRSPSVSRVCCNCSSLSMPWSEVMGGLRITLKDAERFLVSVGYLLETSGTTRLCSLPLFSVPSISLPSPGPPKRDGVVLMEVRFVTTEHSTIRGSALAIVLWRYQVDLIWSGWTVRWCSVMVVVVFGERMERCKSSACKSQNLEEETPGRKGNRETNAEVPTD